MQVPRNPWAPQDSCYTTWDDTTCSLVRPRLPTSSLHYIVSFRAQTTNIICMLNLDIAIHLAFCCSECTQNYDVFSGPSANDPGFINVWLGAAPSVRLAAWLHQAEGVHCQPLALMLCALRILAPKCTAASHSVGMRGSCMLWCPGQQLVQDQSHQQH